AGAVRAASPSAHSPGGAGHGARLLGLLPAPASPRAQRGTGHRRAHAQVLTHAQIPMSPSLIGADALSRLRSFADRVTTPFPSGRDTDDKFEQYACVTVQIPE